jgi:hypothetical protein
MQPLRVPAERRQRLWRDAPGLHRGGRLVAQPNDRRYPEVVRSPRAGSATDALRPPYVAIAATAAAFLFLLFIVFGGTRPAEPEVASMGTAQAR